MSLLAFTYYHGWTQALAAVITVVPVPQVCSPCLRQLPPLLTEGQPPPPALPQG